MAELKLKPCRECGNEHLTYSERADVYGKIHCPECRNSIEAISLTVAAERWNRREEVE